ncbi:MAG TPA: hypothetical protein PKO15_04630 [Fibrobacteria bacterium]|nr:hypothetical protein [Fibrobacteria bacterium]
MSLDEGFLERFGLDLYRQNPFCVLGLDGRASVKEVRRKQESLEKRRKLGLEAEATSSFLSPTPPPTEEESAAALNRLTDPKLRFDDEVFWFWTIEGRPNQAQVSLACGDVAAAESIWTEAQESTGPLRAMAMHDQAVWKLLSVLREGGSGPEWTNVAVLWRRVRDLEGFWSLARDRARELNDVRLDDAHCAELREAVFPAVLRLGLLKAIEISIDGQSKTAPDIASGLRGACTGNDLHLFEQVMRQATKPVRNQIQSAIDAAKRQWTATPHKADEIVRGIQDQSVRSLDVLDSLLDDEDVVRQSAHDSVAEAMSDGTWLFANTTNLWKKAISLLESAREIAGSEGRKQKLADEIATLKGNQEAGNDWCSEGYWDLPADTLASMETARAKVKSGDFDGAMDILCSLDPAIGKPLRRAVSNCLSLNAIRTGNAAWNDFEPQSSQRKAILAKIQSLVGTDRLSSFLFSLPTPETPSYMMPGCMCCGSSSYSRWIRFTHKVGTLDLTLFMCSSCSDKEDKEIEKKKATLRASLEGGLARMLLADEVDPGDPGVRKNLDVIKKQVSDLGGSADASKLRAKYHPSKPKITVLPPKAGGGRTCHFCGRSVESQGSEIRLAMSSGIRKTKGLFGELKEWSTTEVGVPRCQGCRTAHGELPTRLRAWNLERDTQLQSPALTAIALAVEAARDAEAQTKSAIADRKKAAKADCERMTEAIRTIESAPIPDERFGWKERIAMGTASAGGVILGSEAFHSARIGIAAGIATMAAGIGLSNLVSRFRNRKRTQLDALKKQLQVKLSELASIESQEKDTLRGLERSRVSAEAALESARAQATESWERTHPRPSLPDGILPEEDYLNASAIQELRNKQWGFGSTASTNPGSSHPTEVRGLVGGGSA